MSIGILVQAEGTVAQSDKPQPQNRLDYHFSERYVSAIQGISEQLWRRYPRVNDPADRDNVIEHTLRRVADHEAKRGEAQNLPALIRHIFPQVVTNLLRKGRYKLQLASLEDSDPKDLSGREHSAEVIEKQLCVAEILQQLDNRSRSVLTLRYIAGFDTDEVARMLGLTSENVRQIIHRASEKFRSGG